MKWVDRVFKVVLWLFGSWFIGLLSSIVVLLYRDSFQNLVGSEPTLAPLMFWLFGLLTFVGIIIRGIVALYVYGFKDFFNVKPRE